MAEATKDSNTDFDLLRADFEALKVQMNELMAMFKSETKEKVNDIKQDLEDGGERLSEQLRKLLEKGSDATQTAAQSATHNLEHQVSAHPLMSLLSAFGVGLLVAKWLDKR
jgi:ElaB/YqjD/DUF883 family membrane-anchored ribosome-binding protein